MRKEQTFFVMLILSVLSGLFLVWMDSRPGWDDTGITAGLIVVFSALFGFLQPERPWIWALTVSVWIPLYALFLAGDYMMFLVTLFGFAGAYLGAAVKKNKPSSN